MDLINVHVSYRLNVMYADPVSKARKIYLRMDKAGDNKIVLDARVTTKFNKLEGDWGEE